MTRKREREYWPIGASRMLDLIIKGRPERRGSPKHMEKAGFDPERLVWQVDVLKEGGEDELKLKTKV